MKMVFDEDDRYSGHGAVKKAGNRTIKQVSESELNGKVPDDWEDDWKEYRRHFKLVDGEIVFDEGFEPEAVSD